MPENLLKDYIQVQRVWWDYDSGDPEHPPNWRNFKLWPGDISAVSGPVTDPTIRLKVRI